MLCKKCGAQIPDESAKCEYCGEVFKEEPETVNEQADMGDTQVVELSGTENNGDSGDSYAEDLSKRSTHEIFEENARKRKSQAEKVIDEKQQQLEEITMRRNQKKLKQRRNKIILITCVCVLVAAAAGFGTYYVRNGGIGTVIATPAPSGTPIPSLAPVQTSNVQTPDPAASASEAPESDNSVSGSQSGSAGTGGTSSAGSSASGGGSSSSSGGSSSSSSSGSGSSSSSSGTASSGASSGGTSSASSGTNVNTGKYSGVVSNSINASLVIGGEVIYDSASDKYFMTFNKDGVMYYANVSKGSTTEQIRGKYITITAEPTNGRYNGNTVYEITNMTYYEGDYIIPDSGTRVIEKSEIQSFSKDELSLARNEIYARHGRKFQMEVYQKYFESKSWYKVNSNYDYTDDNKNLNSIELKNVETILSVENTK